MSRQIWTIAAGKTASATLIITMALGAGQAVAQAGYTAFPVPQQAAPAQSVYLGGQQQAAEAAQTEVVNVSEPYTVENGQIDPAAQAYTPVAQGYAVPHGYGIPQGYAPIPPHAPHAPVEFDYGVSDANQTVYIGESHALGYGAQVPHAPHAPHQGYVAPAYAPQGYAVGQDTVYYEAPASYPTYPAYPSAPQAYEAPQQPMQQQAAAPAQPAEPAAPAAPATQAAPGHYVQLGAFSNSANAEKLLRAMNERGENAFVDATTVNGREFHRVRLGPIVSREDAWAALNRVRGLGYADARVVRN